MLHPLVVFLAFSKELSCDRVLIGQVACSDLPPYLVMTQISAPRAPLCRVQPGSISNLPRSIRLPSISMLTFTPRGANEASHYTHLEINSFNISSTSKDRPLAKFFRKHIRYLILSSSKTAKINKGQGNEAQGEKNRECICRTNP